MKDILKEYAAYNTWANQKLCETILKLSAEKQKTEVPGSFKSLYLTLLHMWSAESIWWQRMKLQERLIIPGEYFKGDMQELVNGLHQQNVLWEQWISNASPAALQHVFQYFNSRKESFKQPVYQMLLHVFNHGTYHRGQLVNILRQLGIEKIPQTDFIVYSRSKKQVLPLS